MKTKKLLKIKIIALGICLIVPAIASAIPGIPHQFYGTVKFADGSAPDGTVVEAKIGDITVVSTQTKYGKYGYNDSGLFYVDNPNSSTEKTIQFFVDEVNTGKTAVFEAGKIENLNLTLDTDIPTDNDPGVQTNDPPADSGNTEASGGNVTAPVVETTSTNAVIVGDVNGNSKVDKYDFALMMMAWGQTGSGLSADLNEDGKVDKYDFSLLMLNWGKTS